MSWDHRLVQFRDGDETITQLSEVFYSKNGKPSAFSQASVFHSSTWKDNEDAVKSCVSQLGDMLEGSRRPVLIHPDDFTGDILND